MKAQSLARNTMFSGLISISNVLLLAVVISAARILGQKSFGVFSFALSLSSIFEMVVDFGLNVLVARDLARDRSRSAVYLPHLLGWKMILSAVALMLLVATVYIMGKDSQTRLVTYIMGTAIVLRSFKATSHAFFQSHERFDLLLLTTYIERVLILVFGVAVLFITHSLIAFAASFALVRIPDVLISYYMVHRHIAPVRIGLNSKTIRLLQIAAVPFGLNAFINTTYWQIGTVMLSWMRPAAEVGLYSAGFRIYEGLTLFPTILGTALLPRLSKLYADEREKFRSVALQSLRYLAIGAFPLIISFGILTPQIVSLLFGRSYLPTAHPLRVLLGAAILMFANWTFNTILISANMEGYVMKVAAIGLAVGAAANGLLISRYGSIGAGYAVVAGEVCMYSLLLLRARNILARFGALSLAWKPILASAIAVGASLAYSPPHPVVKTILFILLYSAMLYLLRAFSSSDLSLIKSLFPSKVTDSSVEP